MTNCESLSEWSPLPIQPKKIPGGHQDQGHGVVLHDQGDDYQ